MTAQVRIAGGVATPAYTIDAGNMTVNGTAVKVTDKGVEAANPTGNDALQQVVNGQLDQALKGAGLEVFLTAPDVVAAGDSGHVAVSGLHVRYTQPNDNPAVPTQSVEYILGEARAFAFVVPGEGAPSVSASVGVGAGSSGPSTSGVTTNPSAAHPTATPPSSETATAAAPSGDSSSPIALLRPVAGTRVRFQCINAGPRPRFRRWRPLAVFFLVLGSPFLFAVQIIVYAGAIMVLFLFVIMLLGVAGAARPRS